MTDIIIPVPFSVKSDQCKRIAARYNLGFHIDEFNYLVEHAGFKSEQRPATETELELWRALFPKDFNPEDVLDVTAEEIENIVFPGFQYYFNKKDYNRLTLKLGNKISFQGHSSVFNFTKANSTSMIYSSKVIPKGYYIQSEKYIHDLSFYHPYPNKEYLKGLSRELKPICL